MSISQGIYRSHRIVLIRAHRAALGEPLGDRPDIDDRGFNSPYRAPIFGVAKGKTVVVRLIREKLDTSANLYVTSSDTGTVVIADPADGKLPNATAMDVKITGVDGGSDKKEAKLEVRFDAKNGVVIYQVYVRVFKELDVDITPHRITINGADGAGMAPTVDIDAVMKKVSEIWIHYGIRFTVHATINRTVTFAKKDIAADLPPPAEIADLLNTDWVPNTVNAYFVRQIGTQTVLGYGASRAFVTANPAFHNPGIILADRTAATARGYVMFWANDLAHEIGHFFTLPHAEDKEPPDEREDTWSRDMLMHPHNEMRGRDPWPRVFAAATPGPPPTPAVNYKFRPRFNDTSYGTRRRGCIVTLKDLTQLAHDAECARARSTITSTAGPY